MKVLTVRPDILVDYMYGQKDLNEKTGLMREYRRWQPKDDEGNPYRGEILLRSNSRQIPTLPSRMAGVIVNIEKTIKTSKQVVWHVRFVCLVHPFKLDEGKLTGFSEVDDSLIHREVFNWCDEKKLDKEIDGPMEKIANAYIKKHPAAKITPLSEFPKEMLALAEKEDAYFSDFLKFIYKPTVDIVQMMSPRLVEHTLVSE